MENTLAKNKKPMKPAPQLPPEMLSAVNRVGAATDRVSQMQTPRSAVPQADPFHPECEYVPQFTHNRNLAMRPQAPCPAVHTHLLRLSHFAESLEREK